MSGKQITELDTADSFEDGDLMLIRKTSIGVDRSLSKAKLIESIGNSAINGYTASSSDTNKISLIASNSAIVPKYCNGMRISFISPISTTDIVQVKIGTLSYVDLQKYSLNETVTLVENEYIEAVYIDGIFKQTNNLNTHLVWSNEYTAEADINKEKTITIYNLTSAIGVKKSNYYSGMSLLFTAPETSKGVVFVNVDDLGNKKLNETGGSVIAKDVYESQAIMAIYDGEKFVKQKFSSIHREPIIPEEITEDIEPVIIPDDIYAPDYTGDPDDPANTTTPNALDSKGHPIFKQTVTVGNKAMYKTLPEAIAALINDYGDDGGGNKFAIELDAEYEPPVKVDIKGRSKNIDLRWITIFAKNNYSLTLSATCFYCICRYTPIFNFKFSVDKTKDCDDSYPGAFYLTNSTSTDSITLTFGKNTVINYTSTRSTSESMQYNDYLVYGAPIHRVEAKYGIRIITNAGFFQGKFLINKGNFVFTSKGNSYLFCNKVRWDHNDIKLNQQMYNTVIKSNITGNNSGIFHLSYRKAYFRNVRSTDRTGKTIGLQAVDSIINMEDCDFASETDGSLNSGYDIVIGYKSVFYNEIHLKNTTGNISHPSGVECKKGIIYRE